MAKSAKEKLRQSGILPFDLEEALGVSPITSFSGLPLVAEGFRARQRATHPQVARTPVRPARIRAQTARKWRAYACALDALPRVSVRFAISPVRALPIFLSRSAATRASGGHARGPHAHSLGSYGILRRSGGSARRRRSAARARYVPRPCACRSQTGEALYHIARIV